MRLAPDLITLESQKEQLSRAFALAVASVAGCGHYRPEPDDDSIDIGFTSRKDGTTLKRPKLEAQLKATARDVVRDEHIAFELDKKNYVDLSCESHVPRILIVVIVPDHPSQWMMQSEFKTHLYRCAYWVSLLGSPMVPNTESVTVYLPRYQMFTAQALDAMMGRIADGGKP